MTTTKKALLRIAIRFLPDHRHHIRAQKIRSLVIINGMRHFVNAAYLLDERGIVAAVLMLKKPDILV